MDSLFNTSKSNKHLWEQISAKMRERGFDRSPTMCTDKWRNLLKEFKKAKLMGNGNNGNGSAKMSYYKEIEEILRERNRCTSSNVSGYKSPSHNSDGVNHSSKVDPFMQFSDKGLSFSFSLVSVWVFLRIDCEIACGCFFIFKFRLFWTLGTCNFFEF